jgi:hypothetical protein
MKNRAENEKVLIISISVGSATLRLGGAVFRSVRGNGIVSARAWLQCAAMAEWSLNQHG